MVFDHRLVQTAVLGDRRSADPVYLPMEREDALEFRRRHPHATFWCGLLLGGCGGRLGPKVYREKVSHFAHHASTNACPRQHGGIESADHLYASKQVNHWLGRQGKPRREPRFTGDFDTGGTCRRVILPATDEHPAIFFEFSTSMTEELDRLFTRTRDESPSWLVKENRELSRRLLQENGFALRFRMRTRNLERILEVGTVGLSGMVRWEPIADCSLTEQGITTRRMEELAKVRHRAPAAAPLRVPTVTRTAPGGSPQEKPHPLLTELQFALEQNDQASVRRLSDQLRLEVRTSQDPGITGFQKKIDALLAWSSRRLEQGQRSPDTGKGPLYRPASSGRNRSDLRKDRTTPDRGKAGKHPPERRTLNTLMNDAAGAYRSDDQNALRQIRAVLRKRRDSASPGDRHRIDWILESYPCADRRRSTPDRKRVRNNGSSTSSKRSVPLPRPEEDGLRSAIAERREELLKTPEGGRRPQRPAPAPSLEELADRINSRRNR
ncbi:hypothetical protein UIS43_24540 [Nocardiopsis sp. LDBS0036]|uniref:hypothetical protein n=1 Tax=Nocardiopsis sp. LDBS0036 TaxID=3104276 RepID=UPI0035184FC0